MKKMFWFLSVSVLVLTGCTQDPYAKILEKDGGQLYADKPAEKLPILPPLVLDMPENVEMFEGKPTEIEIKATVPDPGQPLVTIEGLPDGATFDANTGKLTWTPDYKAGNDERDPRAAERLYTLKVFLRSSEDTLTYIQRPLVLMVRDFARTFKVDYKGATKPITTPTPGFVPPGAVVFTPTLTEEFSEGDTIVRELVVSSEDFPKGPFDLRAQNMPAGASIKLSETDPTKYTFSYQPSALTVNLNEVKTASPSVTFNMEFIATDPSGRIAKNPIALRVLDKRLAPHITAPDIVEQGTNIHFTFRADDLNGEVAPKIIMDPKSLPAFGLFARKRDKEMPATPFSNPWAASFIDWTDIPDDKVGGEADLKFSVCVLKSLNNYEHCTEAKVKVKFTEKIQPSPLVNRASFPQGTVKYLRQNEKIKVPVLVRGQEKPTPIAPGVTVSPEGEGFRWEANNLFIEPKTTGLKQVVLTAKTARGATKTEGFLVEVLPWSWSKNLILTDTPKSEESKTLQSLLDESSVASSELQLTEERILALRELLIVGTTGLTPNTVVETVEYSASKIKNAMILSPLVETFKGKIADELKTYKIGFKSRVRDLTGYVLEVAGSKLQTPADPLKLKTTLSSESKEPLPLDLSGVDKAVCEPILKLTKTTTKDTGETEKEELNVAAVCQRKGGGTLVVSGVEWADIEVGAADKGLLKKWITNLGLVKP